MGSAQEKRRLPSGQDRADSDLDLPEFATHSFIVKIWLEGNGNSDRPVTWRGHITHVPSGQRRYLQNLSELIDFMVPYLEQINARIDAYWRMRRWVKRRIPALNVPKERRD